MNPSDTKEYGADEFDVKTIKDKALLVRLIRRKMNNSKPDEVLTNKVHKDAKVKDKGSVRVFKSLFPKECTNGYTKFMNEASIYFYTMTTPWEDTGYRLLMVKNHSEFTQKLRGYIEKFDESVDVFLDALQDNIKKAESSLGSAFDENDYLDRDALKQSFHLEVKFSAIPDVDDVRLSLPQEELEQIKTDIREQLQEKVTRTTNDLWGRLSKQLTYIQKQMATVKKPSKLSDTLLGNIRDICELIPHLNITNDEELDKMQKNVLNRLDKFCIEDVREDEETRKSLGKEAGEMADEIEQKMQDYMS